MDMCRSRKFCQKGSIFAVCFSWGVFSDEGREDTYKWTQIPLKAGHHLPISEMPFEWRFAGGTMMAKH